MNKIYVVLLSDVANVADRNIQGDFDRIGEIVIVTPIESIALKTETPGHIGMIQVWECGNLVLDMFRNPGEPFRIGNDYSYKFDPDYQLYKKLESRFKGK